MKELTDRLAAINAPISEEDQVVILLGSLPISYFTHVTALEARDAVTLSYVQQSLIRKEQRLKESNIQHTGLDKMIEIGRSLIGKHDGQTGEGIERRSATCVVKQDIFVRIVQRIFIKGCQNPSTKVNLLV